MDNNDLDGRTSVPVPKPRRHTSNNDANLNNKTSYENVSIDLINKNINIKDENLQNNSKNKLQTNKLFLMPTTSANLNNDATNPQILTNLNDLANAPNKNQKNISTHLDEVNKLSNIYNDDENANIKPVPAPRRSSSATKVDNIISNKINCSPSTGAINKQRNTLYNDCIDDTPKTKVSKSSGSYSFGSEDVDKTDGESPISKFALRKSYSNSSLSASQSGSSTADIKYHSASPGQLLKALGTTSKLLTESITERVTTRTKDAKQRIDRIHKSSRDRIAETTKSATNKLKSVRKNLHDTIEMTQNLSLGRKKTNSMNKPDNKSKTAAFELDRPQTVPPNDELFSSISFHSPLNSKTNKCMNINSAESSYEIPKSLRSLSSDSSAFSENAANSSNAPPTYEDVIKEKCLEEKPDQRPNPATRTRRKSKVDSNAYENHEIHSLPKVDSKQKRAESPNSSEDEDIYSMPCPNFPAPVLKERIYGKIQSKQEKELEAASSSLNSIEAPIRTKRRKDYEQVNLQKETETVNSNRATAGSNEFQSVGKYSKLIGEDFSEELSKELRSIEENIPKAVRSDSWSYYDVNSDRSDETSSPEPEPIYENDQSIRRPILEDAEPVYGVIYNSESPESTMLTPVAVARKRRSQERSSGGYAKVNKSPEVKLRSEEPAIDILKEFDPLDRKTLDKILSCKSNELILLESILSGETYGNCAEESNYDYNSTETSENEDIEEIPTPPERMDSLTEVNEEIEEVRERKMSNGENDFSLENRKTVIIHQNSHLRSDSSDNIVDDVTNDSSVSNTVEEKTSNSRWFLGSAAKSENKGKTKPDKKKPVSDATDEEKPMTPLTKTSSMKSMFSNVMNKVEGIKRKTSFRSNPNKNEVKIVLEMIPRPCLTQRLILHEGHLIRLPTGVVEDILKELHSRKAYIRDKKFQAYFDKDLKTPKENIPLEWITTIQCVYNHKFSNNFVDIYCFEITTAIPKNVGNNLSNPNMVVTSNNSGNTKAQRVCHLYGVAKVSERFLWMQKLLESLTDVFPPGFSCPFYRAGWCYSKVICSVFEQNKFHLLFLDGEYLMDSCVGLYGSKAHSVK